MGTTMQGGGGSKFTVKDDGIEIWLPQKVYRVGVEGKLDDANDLLFSKLSGLEFRHVEIEGRIVAGAGLVD
jgi:hypothetical protein